MSSAQKLVDAWYGKGVGSLRVKSVPVPKFSREIGEAVLAHLLVSGYIQEDFHFTPYSTISYLKRGMNRNVSCIYFSVLVVQIPKVNTIMLGCILSYKLFFVMFLKVRIRVL